MKLDVDLDLLGTRFKDLSNTPYFKVNIRKYATYLSKATDHILRNVDQQPESIRREYSRFLWVLYKYIAGSTVSESPYEMEYCLSSALKDWTEKDCAIATTLSTDLDFHFMNVEAKKRISIVAPSFDHEGFDIILAPIALPSIYKHRPLYCTPLYHELGHFIDRQYAIADLSLLTYPGDVIHPDPGANTKITSSHRAEFFSDLFAAQYIGDVASKYLEEIAPGATISYSHPATAQRSNLIYKFLNGEDDPIINAIQSALKARRLPELKIRFELVDVSTSLDDIRPINVQSTEQLHGLFPSVWSYLENIRAGKNESWNKRNVGNPAIDRSINDLLEKSIRNHSCRSMWNNAATN